MPAPRAACALARTQVTSLPRLASLDVSSNCLSVIPEELAALAGSLTNLDISNNSRVALPASLGRLRRLQHLNISWVWSDLGALWAGAAGLEQLKVRSSTRCCSLASGPCRACGCRQRRPR